jgi:hypothetical protein
MSKYDPILEDNNYWKYQGLLESFHSIIKNDSGFLYEKGFIHSLAHIARKVYEMGYYDAIKYYESNNKDITKRKGKIN